MEAPKFRTRYGNIMNLDSHKEALQLFFSFKVGTKWFIIILKNGKGNFTNF